jgi:signal peptidase I
MILGIGWKMKSKAIGVVILLVIAVIAADSTVGPGFVLNKVFSGLFLGSMMYDDVNNQFTDHFQATSESMEPIIMKGNEVQVDRSIQFEELEIGDIMVFYSNPDERMLLGRIVEVIEEEPYTLRTQGDANPGSIPVREYPITAEQYIGKITMIYPNYNDFVVGKNGINPYDLELEE